MPWDISPDFPGLSPCYGLVAYVLLTRAPVAGKGIATSPLPLDLHVLGLSLAFILSQDQTLRCIFLFLFFSTSKVVPSALMPDYLSSGFEFVLTLTYFLYPLFSGYPSRTTFVYCNAFKDLVLLSAFVKRKWCKDNAFLFFLPNFQKFFFIFSSYRSPLPKSVAKIRLFINLFQIFYRVFYAVKHNFLYLLWLSEG